MEDVINIGEMELERDFFTTVRMCESSLRTELDYNEENISVASYRKYIVWFNKEFNTCHSIPPLRNKRQYSSTHRIEVAYRSKYRCNACNILLPPTFEVDHIKELRNGGEDVFSNLQALCPNCHALKTRANDLRKHAVFADEFGKRADVIETDAFEKFKRIV
jgi:5-methylcytosine-specific restriction endonuclease McrA